MFTSCPHSYLRFSTIAARQVRASLKKDIKANADRETFTIKRSDVKKATN